MIRQVHIFVLWFLLFSVLSLQASQQTDNLIVNKAELFFHDDTDKRLHKIVDTHIIVRPVKTESVTLTFYRFDLFSDTIIDFGGKKLPVRKSYAFSPGDKVYIVANIPSVKQDTFSVIVKTRYDSQKLLLHRIEKGETLFSGSIETSVRKADKTFDDGILYVADTDNISVFQTAQKSRNTELIASAKVTYTLETLEAAETNKSPVWLSQTKLFYPLKSGEYEKGILTLTNQSGKDLENTSLHFILPSSVNIAQKRFTQENPNLTIKQTPNGYTLKLTKLKKGENLQLSYYLSVTLSQTKDISGEIFLTYKGKQLSNKLKLRIRMEEEDIFTNNKGFILGKIKGIPEKEAKGIRLYLSDGQSVSTDTKGRYHFQDISEGLHVIQIDTDTIPQGYRPGICKESTKNAQSAISSFVDVRAHMVKRVDFCLEKEKNSKKHTSANSKSTKKIRSLQMPKYSSSDIAKYKETYKWLWPPHEGYVPSIGSVKIALLYPKKYKLRLYLNEKEVDTLNSDGVLKNRKYQSAIALFRGIDIQEGDNYFIARIVDENNKVVHTMQRVVHFSTAPYKAKIRKDLSHLVADGKTPPLIAVELRDKDGYIVRESMKCSYFVDPPYKSLENKAETSGKSTMQVEQNGIAYIRLQPTSLASTVKIHIPVSNDDEALLSVKLEPKMRDWILVGFAEGSAGYRTITKALQKTEKKEIYHEGRVAFFAKGTIRGDTLLTLAYDTGKEKNLEVFEKIDPAKYYTIYGDGSYQNIETPSQRKLFVKLEKKEYTALFGDYRTDLDSTQLSRYNRTLNGIKALFSGKKADATFFISESENNFVKEELLPDGTSGKYYTKHKNIIRNSEKVYLVVRDKFQKEKVLSKRVLTPLIDYTIYYDEGSLYFKEPVSAIATDGNPRYIEIEYEVSGTTGKQPVYGGHVTYKGDDARYRIGATYIKENRKSLQGIDLDIKYNEHIRFKAEYAKTKEDLQKGTDAYLLESVYKDRDKEITLYYRELEKDFGLSQQSTFETNSRRYGIQTRLKYYKYYELYLDAYTDTNLLDETKTNVFELKNSYRTQNHTLYAGYKYYSDALSSGTQLLGGFSKHFFNNRLKISFAQEYALENDNPNFPTRSTLQSSYAINSSTDLIFTGILSTNNQNSVTSFNTTLRTAPWKNAVMKTSILSSRKNDTESIYGNYMLTQGFSLTKNLSLSASVERNDKLRGEEENSEQKYTTYSLSGSYKKGAWYYSAKSSYKESNESKINLDLNAYTQREDINLAFALGIRTQKRYSEFTKAKYDINANCALAYRDDKDTVLFNRFDYRYTSDENTQTQTFTNITAINKQFARKFEFALQYALKFAKTSMEGETFTSLLDLLGVDVTYDIGSRNDIGINAKLMHDWKRKKYRNDYGVFTGYRLFKNGYVSLGYNFRGLSGAKETDPFRSYQGLYLNVRMKIDQSSLKEIVTKYRK